MANPQKVNRERAKPRYSARTQEALDRINTDADEEKNFVAGGRSVILTDPDAGTNIIIQKEDGLFKHEDLAEVLIRCGPKAEIETEKFTRKRYNTYFCKITNLEVHASAWAQHVQGRRKFALRRKIMEEERQSKLEREQRRKPPGMPEVEPIPREEINKMTEQEFEEAMCTGNLLWNEWCLVCNNRVLRSIWVTHCVGKNHKGAFTQRPVRKVAGTGAPERDEYNFRP